MRSKTKKLEYIKNIKLFFSCYFSFNGIYGRVLFWEALLFGYLILYVFSKIQIPYFDILGWLGYFYISLNAYQKRCRDLSLKGSWIILIVTVFFVYMAVTHPLGIDKTEFFLPISQAILVVYLCVYLYALFMPGKKEKKPDLTSPLLKHPRIYFAACLVVFLIGRWLLLHYDFVL